VALGYLEVILSASSKRARDRAEASLRKKQEQAREGEKAMGEYEAAARAVLENTVRLRALRLAKEAAEAAAGIKRKPLAARKKRST
jgi:3-hydroxyacyl-CoA dehydrogenase